MISSTLSCTWIILSPNCCSLFVLLSSVHIGVINYIIDVVLIDSDMLDSATSAATGGEAVTRNFRSMAALPTRLQRRSLRLAAMSLIVMPYYIYHLDLCRGFFHQALFQCV